MRFCEQITLLSAPRDRFFWVPNHRRGLLVGDATAWPRSLGRGSVISRMAESKGQYAAVFGMLSAHA